MKHSGVLEISSPAKVHKASLPISRNNASGYERPERARTSHACEPCRERKTKCDGERPSCHRCQHTGTVCHYGYGKGWRKRKTAEDLNVTSRRLQIYETLLNNIYLKVDLEIRAMIDEARSQDVLGMDEPEAMDSPTGLSQSNMNLDLEHPGSATGAHLPRTLPIPTSLVSPPGRPSQLAFDRTSESTSPLLAHHPKREKTFEELSANRLPSITPQGLLIENGTRDSSPGYPRSASSGGLNSLTRQEHFSPNSTSPLHDLAARTGSSPGFDRLFHSADRGISTHAAPAFGLTAPNQDLSRQQHVFGHATPVASH